MSIELKMPALSPTMEEGTLAKWLVKVGDKVSSGDLLAEIETDKATMEFEAIDEGVVTELLVAEGTDGAARIATFTACAGDENVGLVELGSVSLPITRRSSRGTRSCSVTRIKASSIAPIARSIEGMSTVHFSAAVG